MYLDLTIHKLYRTVKELQALAGHTFDATALLHQLY